MAWTSLAIECPSACDNVLCLSLQVFFEDVCLLKDSFCGEMEETALGFELFRNDFLAFDFVKWISEWQTIVGMVAVCTWRMWANCITTLQMCWERLCHGHASEDLGRSTKWMNQRDSLRLLLVGVGIFFLVFGTLKHLPALAVTFALSHTLLMALLELRYLVHTAKMQTDGDYRQRTISKAERQNWQVDGDLAVRHYHICCFKGRVVRFSENRELDNVEELEPVSVYSDFEGSGLLDCTTVFVLQVMLYVVLLLSVVQQPSPRDQISDRQVMFYVGGAIISIVMQLRGETFKKVEWKPFWRHYFYQGFQKAEHWSRVRISMSWLVNQVFAQTTMLMVPVILMEAGDYMDFVKDATSILFIAELDVLSGSITNVKKHQFAQLQAIVAQPAEQARGSTYAASSVSSKAGKAKAKGKAKCKAKAKNKAKDNDHADRQTVPEPL